MLFTCLNKALECLFASRKGIGLFWSGLISPSQFGNFHGFHVFASWPPPPPPRTIFKLFLLSFSLHFFAQGLPFLFLNSWLKLIVRRCTWHVNPRRHQFLISFIFCSIWWIYVNLIWFYILHQFIRKSLSLAHSPSASKLFVAGLEDSATHWKKAKEKWWKISFDLIAEICWSWLLVMQLEHLPVATGVKPCQTYV